MDLISTDSTDRPLDLSRKSDELKPSSEHTQKSALAGRDPFTSSHRYHAGHANVDERISELESENQRLHRLVAELLIKNQQLRRADGTA